MPPAADLRAQVEDWGKPTSFGGSTSFSGVVQSLKVLDAAARTRQPAALAPADNRNWAAPAQAQLSKSQQRRQFRSGTSTTKPRAPTLASESPRLLMVNLAFNLS
jgi:hypothetical protein